MTSSKNVPKLSQETEIQVAVVVVLLKGGEHLRLFNKAIDH